jgi:hypothetical protein
MTMSPYNVVRREEHKLHRGSIWLEFVTGETPPCSPNVIKFQLLGGYKLKVWFKDGKSGEVDVSDLFEFEGELIKPLADLDFFRKVTINPELGVLCWPNEMDVDPGILYSAVTGEPIRIRDWKEEGSAA